MKMHSLLTVFVAATAALAVTPACAQAIDPCTVYLCMSAMSGSGTPGDPSCIAAIDYWHAPTPVGLAIYHPPQGFNPPASAALRRTYMSTCEGTNVATNAAILNTIISQWGSVP